MQQVSARAFATAIAIDPSQLPALLRSPRRRSRFHLGRLWVLHRRRVVQTITAAIVLVGIVGIYQVRGQIGVLGADLYDLGERQLAHSPLGIQRISMSGQAMTSEKAILAALNITPQTSMVNFDADAARAAIEALPAVLTATVRKDYPNRLNIAVVERVPVARWRVDGVTYLIDQSGAKISANGDASPGLPLIVGEDAGDDAMVMIRAMNQYPALKSGLAALSRIADRRWDMIFRSGLRVQLPEQGVAQALAQLTTLEQHFQVLERDVTVIDLRVQGVVAVKPTEAAAKQLAAIAKANIAKNKGNFKEDADYSAPGR